MPLYTPRLPSKHDYRYVNQGFSSVRADLAKVYDWAIKAPRIRRDCDMLYQEAKVAHMRGEYDRAQRRLDSLKWVLKKYGLRGL